MTGPTSPDAPQSPIGTEADAAGPRKGRAYTPPPSREPGGFGEGAPIVEPPEPARKGKAHCFIKTDRGLFPFSTLLKAEINKEKIRASQQIESERKFMTDKGLVPTPFDLEGLLNLMENCSYYDACCRQIARDVVGQGYDLTLREGTDDEDDKQKPQRKELEDFLDDVTDAEIDSIEDVAEKAITDFMAIGWMALEISRGGNGLVTGIFHVPAQTIRVHKSGEKFCQVRGTEKVWFKRFGLEEEISAKTGEKIRTKKIIDEDGTEREIHADEAEIANELIFIKRYYSRSSFYGAPPILPAVGSVAALVGIRDYNLAFFENYGVPSAIVTLTGDWEEEAIGDISNFIDVEIKGSGNQHKTIVLNPPTEGTVEWKPLVVEVKEGHFKLYSKQLRDEVLICYNMPPYRIGIAEMGALGGNLAAEATKIYASSTVNPMKRLTERIITKLILRKGRAVQDYDFWWNDMDTRDIDSITDRAVKAFGIGGLSRNEFRKETGRDVLPEEEGGDQFFIQNNYVPIEESGLAPGEQPGSPAEAQITDLQDKVDKALTQIKNGGLNNAQRSAPRSASDFDPDEDGI